MGTHAREKTIWFPFFQKKYEEMERDALYVPNKLSNKSDEMMKNATFSACLDDCLNCMDFVLDKFQESWCTKLGLLCGVWSLAAAVTAVASKYKETED